MVKLFSNVRLSDWYFDKVNVLWVWYLWKNKMTKKFMLHKALRMSYFYFLLSVFEVERITQSLFHKFCTVRDIAAFCYEITYEFLAQISIMPHSCAFCNGWRKVQPQKIQPQIITLRFSTSYIKIVLFCWQGKCKMI